MIGQLISAGALSVALAACPQATTVDLAGPYQSGDGRYSSATGHNLAVNGWRGVQVVIIDYCGYPIERVGGLAGDGFTSYVRTWCATGAPGYRLVR